MDGLIDGRWVDAWMDRWMDRGLNWAQGDTEYTSLREHTTMSSERLKMKRE